MCFPECVEDPAVSGAASCHLDVFGGSDQHLFLVLVDCEHRGETIKPTRKIFTRQRFELLRHLSQLIEKTAVGTDQALDLGLSARIRDLDRGEEDLLFQCEVIGDDGSVLIESVARLRLSPIGYRQNQSEKEPVDVSVLVYELPPAPHCVSVGAEFYDAKIHRKLLVLIQKTATVEVQCQIVAI